MVSYQPTLQQNWQGRIDGSEPDLLRWHQVMQCIDLQRQPLPAIAEGQLGIALIGFSCDEGVRRNQGRVGADRAPEAIRKACCNLPVMASHIVMVDAGDVLCRNTDLEGAQALLGKQVSFLRSKNYLPLVLGGGHEVAFANFSGIAPFHAGMAFGLINFDAHFDLRQVEAPTGPTSGTGIWQMKEHCRHFDAAFHYLALGIQSCSNTRRLFETAADMGSYYVLAEEFAPEKLEHLLQLINGVIAHSHTLQLTIDMDVFAAAYAPGVSAPAFNGIAPNMLFKRLLRHIIFSGKLASVDIAELNPLYDIDNRTAKLAASLLFDIVQAADMNAEYPSYV